MGTVGGRPGCRKYRGEGTKDGAEAESVKRYCR